MISCIYMNEDLPLRIVYLGQIFIIRTKSFFRHPVLGVLLCGNCLEFYQRDDWTRDEEGNYEQCRFLHWAKYSETAYVEPFEEKKVNRPLEVLRTLKAQNRQFSKFPGGAVKVEPCSNVTTVLRSVYPFFAFVGWFILLFRHSARSAWAKMWAGKILFNFKSPKSATKSKDSFQGIY